MTASDKRGASQILCPTCDAPSAVKTGGVGHRLANGELPRRRVCNGPSAHEFTTFERRQETSLERILIRESGGQRLRPFDRVRLAADLNRYLLGTLSNQEQQAVVSAAVDDITYRLEQIVRPLSDAERKQQAKHDYTHYIWDRHVRAAVGRTLKSFGGEASGEAGSRYRVSHVLYALATFGALQYRADGWHSASDVVAFLEEEYPSHNAYRPSTEPRSRPEQRWWAPSVPLPTTPTTVIKKGVSELGHELRERPFDWTRFERSVRNALAGRPHPDQTADQVVRWTLWQLVGQRVVLSTQLAAAVADCLRRLDDVAYLRWTTIAKRLTVTRIRDEAISLIEYPSPRLIFNEGDTPRLTPPTEMAPT